MTQAWSPEEGAAWIVLQCSQELTLLTPSYGHVPSFLVLGEEDVDPQTYLQISSEAENPPQEPVDYTLPYIFLALLRGFTAREKGSLEGQPA